MTNYKKVYRVRASVYPTPHNKIWLSSGRVPLYDLSRYSRNLNLSFCGLRDVRGIRFRSSRFWGFFGRGLGILAKGIRETEEGWGIEEDYGREGGTMGD